MIYIGADHRGFELKGKLLEWLNSEEIQSEDCGAFKLDPNDDYTIFANAVAEKVASNDKSKGIVICSTGDGVDIVANKHSNIRCGLGFDVDQVKKSREDDDINVLALASDFTNEQKAKDLIQTFLNTTYQPTENHERRLEEIS